MYKVLWRNIISLVVITIEKKIMLVMMMKYKYKAGNTKMQSVNQNTTLQKDNAITGNSHIFSSHMGGER